MKRVLFSIALLTSNIASASIAIDGWYISAFGGVSSLSSTIHTRFLGTLHSDDRYKLGYNAGGRIGYKSNPMRYEFEYTYVHANAKSFLLDGVEPINIGGQASAHIPMVNLYYDFPEFLDAISPFIGIGIGYSLMKTSLTSSGLLTGTSSSITFFSQTANQFAYQGIAGLTYNFSENYAISANYRYTATTTNKRFGRSFQVQMGNAGIIYRFDGCNYK